MCANTPEQAETSPEVNQRQTSNTTVPVAPDGGYGWVILVASFLVGFLVDGVGFSVGIFVLKFLDEFDDSKSKTSWIASVLNGMYMVSGPVTGALITKFSCRSVTIVGSLIAAAGSMMAAFAPSINILILTFGGVTGFGFGLMYLPSIVMVGFYFNKRRALATGIAVCGSGIGAFVFAPLTETTIRAYGWRGALMILSGVCLNGMVSGALFRPLQQKTFKLRNNNEMNEAPRESTRKRRVSIAIMEKTLLSQEARAIEERLRSAENIFCITKCNSMEEKPESKSPIRRKRSAPCRISIALEHYIAPVREIHINMEHDQQDQGGRYRSFNSIIGVHLKHFYKSLVSLCSEVFDLTLLKNPVFVIYGISCVLCMTGFFVPFIFLPDYAVSNGISANKAAFIVSIIGIANTVARVLTGWVCDRSWSNALVINNTSLIIGGVATMFCTYITEYYLLAAYSCVFGVSIAVFVSLRSILMVELIGLEKLTSSLGLVTLFQGSSSLIGAPIAGALFDMTGSYKIPFYVAGGCMILSGVVCLPIRWLHTRRSNRKEQEI